MPSAFARPALVLLLAGAVVNLAAGVRRPPVERAILARGHYPALDQAAAAVRAHVPEGNPLALLGYEGDMLGELDLSIWADFRLKWLLYPRPIAVYQQRPDGPHRREGYEMSGGGYSARATPVTEPYVLVFRGSAEPARPAGWKSLAGGEMFLLLRRPIP